MRLSAVLLLSSSPSEFCYDILSLHKAGHSRVALPLSQLLFVILSDVVRVQVRVLAMRCVRVRAAGSGSWR